MLGAFLTGMSNLSVQNESVNEEFELSAEDRAFFENCEGIPCADAVEYAIPRIMMENNENFYRLAMAITADEIQHYISTNEEVVYEESKLKTIFSKISDIIKDAWRKLQGIFDKVFQTIASWVAPDKKYAEDHKDTVSNFAGEIEIKGYEFANLESVDVYKNMKAAVAQEYKVFKGKNGKDPEEEAAKLRGVAVKKDSVSTEDFTNELKELFFGSKEEKAIKFGKAQAETILKQVADAKKWEKAARNAHAECKKYFEGLQSVNKAAEKLYNAEEHGDESKDNVSKAVAAYITYTNKAIASVKQVMSVHVKAINKARSQSKAVIAQMVIEANKAKREEGKKDDKKAVNASASMLEGLSLI